MEKDIVSKDIFKDKERFADVFNNTLFKADIVKAENLSIIDTAEVYSDEKIVQGRFRDVIMEMKNDCTLAILGLENQISVDNIMPLRSMTYNGLAYMEQLRNFKNKILPKNAKLKPVITLILYYGSTSWNGPTKLYDILEINDERLKPFIPDYPINVISICDLSEKEIENYDTDIKLFFGIIKALNSGKKFKNFCNKHNKDFKNIRTDMKNSIKYFCSSEEYDEILKKCESEGGIDMCVALDQIAQEARLEGEIEGEIKGKSQAKAEFIKSMQSLGYPEEEIQKIIQNIPEISKK